jgi:hypothetical protein
MTTLEIEQIANRDGIVTNATDIDFAIWLRRAVIPKFEKDVGNCDWRRKTATVSIVNPTRAYDLPTDFDRILETPMIQSGADSGQMFYIGENPQAIAAAIANTTPGKPYSYWYSRVTGPPTELRKLELDVIPSVSWTFRYSYLRKQRFADYTTAVELSDYIPEDLQWGLVEGLRFHAYRSRMGVGDPNAIAAKAAYDAYVEDARNYRESSPRNAVKRIGSN